jgi:hypothetical protein
MVEFAPSGNCSPFECYISQTTITPKFTAIRVAALGLDWRISVHCRNHFVSASVELGKQSLRLEFLLYSFIASARGGYPLGFCLLWGQGHNSDYAASHFQVKDGVRYIDRHIHTWYFLVFPASLVATFVSGHHGQGQYYSRQSFFCQQVLWAW